MKRFDKITLMLMVAILLSVPVSYAVGPGFNYNNQTWNSNGGDDDHSGGDDDDSSSGGDDDDYGCDDDWNDDDSNEIPLDGGLSFLAAAGAAYGVKRIRDNSKKK